MRNFKWKVEYVPVIPIRLSAVNLCALSAHTLPLTRTLSKVETFASLARCAASLNRRTFCCGVSPGGPATLCVFAFEDPALPAGLDVA
jgi:hypothetical protein